MALNYFMFLDFRQHIPIAEIQTAVEGLDRKWRRVGDACLAKQRAESFAVGAHVAVRVLPGMAVDIDQRGHEQQATIRVPNQA